MKYCMKMWVIFMPHCPTGIKSEPSEIFCNINDSDEAQFITTELLIASDVATPCEFPAVLHNVVGCRVHRDEYISAFPLGTVPLHMNN